MADATRLGQSIRAIRQRRGWKLHDLADATGLSDSMISLIETGKRHPSWDTLDNIASVLGYVVHVTLRPRRSEVMTTDG